MRRLISACLILLALGATPALAHIEVLPTRAVVGEAQPFTIRVPSEGRDTVAITITFPANVTVFSLRPAGSGFRTEPLLGPTGELAGARYTGGRFGASTHEDFEVLGTPGETGLATWRVQQRLADGTTVDWTGPPETEGEPVGEPAEGEPGPAAAIEIVDGPLPADDGGGSDEDGAALWLALIAAGLAIIALVVAGLLWASRPMTLPEDDDK